MSNKTDLGTLDLLVFQGTPLCNINCKYCYLPDRSNNNILSLEIIGRSMQALIDNGLIKSDFTILWHAGEPLVLSIDYYKTALKEISKYIPSNIKVTHSFQTNGILLTKQWCEFIFENNLEIGVSLDGPKLINDQNRLNKAGKSTFDQALNGIKLLKENNLPVNIISVVTDNTINFIDEFFDFFINLKINKLSLNVEEIEGFNSQSSFSKYSNSELKDRLEYFFSKLFTKYLEYGKPFKLREYDWTSQRILFSNINEQKPFASELTNPFSIVTIATNGDYTTFSPELITQKNSKGKDFIIGNFNSYNSINENRYNEILNELRKGIDKCKASCEYYGLCSGGTPSNKNSEHGTLDASETKFCITTVKAPIDALIKLT